MIADHETTVVFVADTLERQFPAVYSGLGDILGRHGIPLRIIPGTRSVWCRDYMPIQVSEDRFVQFCYAPDYLTGRYRHLRADGQIGPSMPFLRDCGRSAIVVDGGNVIRWKDAAILTEKIYAENPRRGRKVLDDEVCQALGVRRVIITPVEPGDVVGHSDGIVRFVNGETVLVNDYGIADENYGCVLHRSLSEAGLRIVELPYEPVIGPPGGIPSAVGNYLNFLQVGQLIIVPTYGKAADEEAREVLRRSFPGVHLVSLDALELSAEGGVFNCISWTVQDLGNQHPGR